MSGYTKQDYLTYYYPTIAAGPAASGTMAAEVPIAESYKASAAAHVLWTFWSDLADTDLATAEFKGVEVSGTAVAEEFVLAAGQPDALYLKVQIIDVKDGGFDNMQGSPIKWVAMEGTQEIVHVPIVAAGDFDSGETESDLGGTIKPVNQVVTTVGPDHFQHFLLAYMGLDADGIPYIKRRYESDVTWMGMEGLTGDVVPCPAFVTTVTQSAGYNLTVSQINDADGSWDTDGPDCQYRITLTHPSIPTALSDFITGDTDGDMLVWDATAVDWVLLPAATAYSTDPFLRFGASGPYWDEGEACP